MIKEMEKVRKRDKLTEKSQITIFKSRELAKRLQLKNQNQNQRPIEKMEKKKFGEILGRESINETRT